MTDNEEEFIIHTMFCIYYLLWVLVICIAWSMIGTK